MADNKGRRLEVRCHLVRVLTTGEHSPRYQPQTQGDPHAGWLEPRCLCAAIRTYIWTRSQRTNIRCVRGADPSHSEGPFGTVRCCCDAKEIRAPTTKAHFGTLWHTSNPEPTHLQQLHVGPRINRILLGPLPPFPPLSPTPVPAPILPASLALPCHLPCHLPSTAMAHVS